MSRRLAGLAVLIFLVWLAWPASFDAAYSEALAELIDPPARISATLDLDQAPIQRALEAAKPLRVADLQLTPRAEFHLAARVLGRRDYRRDEWARLAPIDLAMGWGPMSDPAVLAEISIRQRRRFYFWRVDEFPVARQVIETHSANMHIIPGSLTLFERMKSIRSDDRITLSGYLVDVDRDDGWRWRTSMTRSDTGDGACELFLVTAMTILD